MGQKPSEPAKICQALRKEGDPLVFAGDGKRLGECV